jgi:hypothetical protein
MGAHSGAGCALFFLRQISSSEVQERAGCSSSLNWSERVSREQLKRPPSFHRCLRRLQSRITCRKSFVSVLFVAGEPCR